MVMVDVFKIIVFFSITKVMRINKNASFFKQLNFII